MDMNLAIDHLEGEAEKAAASRSRMYAVLSACFRFPSREFHETLRSGQLRQELMALASGLPYRIAEIPPLSADCCYDDFQAEYIRLFDVGVGGPPCPLYGGHYGRARMRTMEETMRFYSHFGLSLSTKERELPDHLVTELEFLHYLTFCETKVLHCGRDAGAFRRATKDFIERQVLRWLPLMARKLEGQKPLPFFTDIVATTMDYAARDKSWVSELGST